MTSPKREDDAPVSRAGTSGTRFDRAATMPHRSGTSLLPAPNPPKEAPRDPRLREHSAPIALPRQPTELLPPPSGAIELEIDPAHDAEVTRRMPSAPSPVAGTIDLGNNRLGDAAMQIRGGVETLNVDGRPLVAQLLTGISAALTATPTTGSLEYVGKQITNALLVAETGAGGHFNEDRLGHLLMELAVEVLSGVDAYSRAARQIARENDDRAATYESLARQAQHGGDLKGALEWKARADERRSHAVALRKTSQ